MAALCVLALLLWPSVARAQEIIGGSLSNFDVRNVDAYTVAAVAAFQMLQELESTGTIDQVLRDKVVDVDED